MDFGYGQFTFSIKERIEILDEKREFEQKVIPLPRRRRGVFGTVRTWEREIWKFEDFPENSRQNFAPEHEFQKNFLRLDPEDLGRLWSISEVQIG